MRHRDAKPQILLSEEVAFMKLWYKGLEFKLHNATPKQLKPDKNYAFTKYAFSNAPTTY